MPTESENQTTNGACRPLVEGLQPVLPGLIPDAEDAANLSVGGVQPYSLADLTRLCEDYHGVEGRFAYEAFAWANATIYDGRLPLPLIQWALTAYGKCIGETRSRPEKPPVITLHPTIWRRASSVSRVMRRVLLRHVRPCGPRYALDVIIHELLHVYIRYVLNHWGGGKSSHDDPVWCSEVMRLSPRLGISDFQAAPTKRQRKDGKMLRVAPAGYLAMADLARWPHTVRPDGYYDEQTVPFSYGVTE